jgi:hypothetical protein
MTARGWRLGILACATLGLAMAARAADQPIGAIKLIIKIAASGKEKIVFVSKDPAFLFPPLGGNDDPGNGSPGGALIDILTRDGGNFTFSVPPGESAAPGWKVKDGATADLYKYVNKDAPAGPVPLKVVVLKEGKVLKFVGKETGVALAGTLGDVVVRITTGSTRNCARFAPATILADEPNKFIAKGAVASSLTDCASGPPTTIATTTTTSTSSTTLPGGVELQGALTATLGRFNYNLTLGLPGANAACNTNFPGTHACSYAELQTAEGAGDLVGLQDIASQTVTSFWAIDNAQPALQQCQDDIGSLLNWEYATAHTPSRGQRVTLNNGTGALGALQSNVQCNIAGASWVGCCL